MQVQTDKDIDTHSMRFTLKSSTMKEKNNCLYSQTHRATKVHILPAPLKVNTAVAFEAIF